MKIAITGEKGFIAKNLSLEISEIPFASLQSRELKDISEPTKKVDEVELPF